MMPVIVSSAVQSQKAVAAHLQSKLLLRFGFARTVVIYVTQVMM